MRPTQGSLMAPDPFEIFLGSLCAQGSMLRTTILEHDIMRQLLHFFASTNLTLISYSRVRPDLHYSGQHLLIVGPIPRSLHQLAHSSDDVAVLNARNLILFKT